MNQCAINGCGKPRTARGLCKGHYMRKYRHGDLASTSPLRSEIHLEDIEWMAETGETWTGATTRLHAKPKTVEQFLYRSGRPDLIARLKARQEAC